MYVCIVESVVWLVLGVHELHNLQYILLEVVVHDLQDSFHFRSVTFSILVSYIKLDQWHIYFSIILE